MRPGDQQESFRPANEAAPAPEINGEQEQRVAQLLNELADLEKNRTEVYERWSEGFGRIMTLSLWANEEDVRGDSIALNSLDSRIISLKRELSQLGVPINPEADK